MFYDTGYCVYKLYKGTELVYVGLTTDMRLRMRIHVDSNTKDFDSIHYTERPSIQDMKDLENNLIYLCRPRYNVAIPSGMRHYSNEIVWFVYPLPEGDRKTLAQLVLEMKTTIPQGMKVADINKDHNLTNTTAKLYNIIRDISITTNNPIILGNSDLAKFLHVHHGTITKAKNKLVELGLIQIKYTDYGLTVYTLNNK